MCPDPCAGQTEVGSICDNEIPQAQTKHRVLESVFERPGQHIQMVLSGLPCRRRGLVCRGVRSVPHSSHTQIALENRAIEKLVTTSSLRMMAQSSFRTRSTVTSTCVSRKNIKNVFNHTCVNVSKLPPLHRAKGTPAIYQPVSSRTILSSRVHSKSTRPDRRAARYVNPAQAPKTKVRCRGARDGKMSSGRAQTATVKSQRK